jgi:hypothetical protein
MEGHQVVAETTSGQEQLARNFVVLPQSISGRRSTLVSAESISPTAIITQLERGRGGT